MAAMSLPRPWSRFGYLGHTNDRQRIGTRQRLLEGDYGSMRDQSRNARSCFDDFGLDVIGRSIDFIHLHEIGTVSNWQDNVLGGYQVSAFVIAKQESCSDASNTVLAGSIIPQS
jgi:hypothetical protein